MSRRSYASTLRREQAAATRERVIRAALQLFARDGYGATSLARIAEQAGVSVETVRSVGPKRVLLERATVLATFGTVDGSDDDVFADIDAAATQHGLRIDTPEAWAATFSALVARLNAASAGIFRALSSAAADDPEVDEVWRQQQRQVRDSWRRYVAWLDGNGWIVTPADREELATTVWLLTLADTYSRMIATGYDEDGYRQWLEASLRRLLFEP